MQNGLIVEEIEHVLDCERKSRLSVGGTEDRLEQVINKLLHCHLHGKYGNAAVSVGYFEPHLDNQ